MKKPLKATKMIEYLEEQLLAGRYPIGTKIPSVRRLSTKFAISFSTALRGIDYLCRKGALEKSAKSGIFVKANGAQNGYSGKCNIAVLIAPYNASRLYSAGIYFTVLKHMQELALKEGITLSVTPFTQPSEQSPFPSDLCNNCDGVIMLREYDHFLDCIPVKVPSVGVLMHNDFGGKTSIVDLDPFGAADQAVHYFETRSVESVVILSDCRPAYINRGRVFQQIWQAEKGQTPELVICGMGECEPIKFRKNTGYLFTSDHLLFNYSLDYLENKGQKLADCYKVLGIDGKSLLDPDFHQFPTIAVDCRQLAECALTECMNRIDNNTRSGRRIYIPGYLTNN